MAVDNLNYYSSGLPAGQQTDKYTSQPGCLKSKNLDIFSSSKSVKATAWSSPTAGEADIVAIDDHGNLVLKTDGKVYDRSSGTETLLVDPSINFPSYNVSYNGINGTYTPATWGTVKDMVVKYEGDEWRSFVVYTDRASYTYSKVPYIAQKNFKTSSNITYDDVYSPRSYGYKFNKTSTSGSNGYIEIQMPGVHMATVPIKIYADQSNDSATDISIQYIDWYKQKYYYDPQSDSMNPRNESGSQYLPTPTGDIKQAPVLVEIPGAPSRYDIILQIYFKFTTRDGYSGYGWNGDLYIDCNMPDEPARMNGYPDGDYNEYYSYLPIDDNRKLVDIGTYYWMPALNYQALYNWEGTWSEVTNREKKVRYDLVGYMGWENDPAMDIVTMISWNEQVYMIGNMNGNGYIIPCDLSGGMGTPFIAYGCEFKGAVNIDYLMYLVGEDRGISQLRVYNGQELVPLLGGNKESQLTDLVGVDEQYKFDGRMVEYRGNLVLTTSDGRIFEYGQTYGGKGGAFIHELPAGAVITDLKAQGNDLIVNYSITVSDVTTDYTITYQDDLAKKNYNLEWSATYPIVLGNHLLEKEESDLYASYILPSSACSLEFWAMANHYHFWTFKSSDNVTLSTTESYKIKGTSGTYALKFIEKNDDQYTFRLEGELPLQTTNEMKIINSSNTEVLTYTDFNHFRKIGTVSATGYEEGEFRFHNLNNKLELPKSHSLQVMVKGKGTVNYTPELFALDLVANQRDRG